MKVVAFGASSSTKSINKTLATYAANLIEGAEVEILDLNDFSIPLFSEDIENDIGQPQAAKDFLAKIGSADCLIVSFAEHNGAYTAAYKNLFDWCTRIEPKVYQGKPTILLATSPGGRGSKSVLELATNALPRFGADIKGTLSVPSFQENFDSQNMELTNSDLRDQLVALVGSLT